MSVHDTLAERQHTHGDFKVTALASQQLCFLMQQSPNWSNMPAYQREALEMIQHKIARLLCGNNNTVDSVRDIIGYAQLYFNELQITEGAIDVVTTKLKRTGDAWLQDSRSV
jgi:hypothetical protein